MGPVGGRLKDVKYTQDLSLSPTPPTHTPTTVPSMRHIHVLHHPRQKETRIYLKCGTDPKPDVSFTTSSKAS